MPPLGHLKRRLDRRFYRLLIGLYRRLFPSRAASGPVRADTVRRLLVSRTDRVGDLVVFTPALAYLRAALPHAEIDVVSAGAGSLLVGDPRVNRVYAYERGWVGWVRAVRELRARRYDVVLSVRLRNHLFEGVFTALVAGRHGARVSARRPPEFVGFFTHLVRVPHGARHITERLFHVARGAIDAVPRPQGARVGRPPASLASDAAADARAARLAAGWGGRPFVAFNAWGSDPRRCFGVGLATDVAVRLAQRYPELVVVLTAPPSAAAEAHAIAQAATARLGDPTGLPPRDATAPDRHDAGPRIVAAPPSANLHDLVALLRRAAVVLTPDTANMHIASAVGVPVLAVYTAVTAADVWGAWGSPRHVLSVPDARPLREVPAADVVRAFDAFWHELHAGSAPEEADRSGS